MRYIADFKNLKLADVEEFGGKNASLGEMITNLSRLGMRIPPGFATTAKAYRDFLKHNKLDEKIYPLLQALDITQLPQLKKASIQIRSWILNASFNQEFIAAITHAYQQLKPTKNISFAVRSSATAEDSPAASFAGQQESFLNISGIDNILLAIKKVYASLFGARSIVYRVQNKFNHEKVAISVGVQKMVRSDCGVSGVMFTLDTESGFDQVVFINASYGLGESIVQGIVNPDEFYVYKPSLSRKQPAILQRNLGAKALKIIYGKQKKSDNSTKTIATTTRERSQFCLTDRDVETLARYAVQIEKHYRQPMDIEWAKDGINGKLSIVQARPETVVSHTSRQIVEHFSLKKTGKIIIEGHSVGHKIGQGKACIIIDPKKMSLMQPGQVLVADMTDPDWEPIMKLAKAIVTNRGGRTCHAAIVARELGIPAVVGCNNATTAIKQHEEITVSCASGELGYIYRGLLPIKIEHIKVHSMPKLPVKLCLNLADPSKAFAYQALPNDGVGLARIELIIANTINLHPKAIFKFHSLTKKLQLSIKKQSCGYSSPKKFYVEKLREGIATIAAAFYPKPIIVRFSDFKTNEYANLLGGKAFEPHEENPMIGFRGASRYGAELFSDCFSLECIAIRRVLDMGLNNVQVMFPFVRTPNELKQLVKLIATHGLKRGKNGVKVMVMCEVPSTAIAPEEFLKYCDGFSIGSNDLTQLTLGLDRDSGLVAHLFDERSTAVKSLIKMAITACRRNKKYIGICGQAPSDYPDFAKWLIDQKIESISLNPDTMIETWLYLAKKFK